MIDVKISIECELLFNMTSTKFNVFHFLKITNFVPNMKFQDVLPFQALPELNSTPLVSFKLPANIRFAISGTAEKGIESLPQTLIFKSLNFCKPMS